MELLEGKVSVWLQSAQFVKAKPGVYVLYDKNLDAIYIGASENLQQTFEKYVNQDFEGNSCKQKTSKYQRIFVDNPKERQNQLLEDYEKEHGTIPSCNAESN
jgi:excinuclease UvrABC nuclease subunit